MFKVLKFTLVFLPFTESTAWICKANSDTLKSDNNMLADIQIFYFFFA